MVLNIRQREILDLARVSGRVGVEELAEKFDVTLQTIRRDLGELSDQGMLDRVHGGAVLRSGVSNIGYEERRRMNDAAKASIARTCASQIPDNSSIILNLGTTTEAVARELMSHRNLTVITNNMNVANILVGNESCDIMVAGGALRRSDGGLVGDLTTDFMAQFKPDFAIIGTSALDSDGDLLDFDMEEVRVSRAIAGLARKTFLVTDISKLQRSAPVRIISMARLDAVFVDQPLPDDLMAKCEGWDTQVFVAR
ncbi:DeoR/GlpR family DNA-binding transcription regulator [Paracoccus sp. Z330]|uniref:DeoR/GlpR family DNA-binding transcription regulator n=1 Tax=Paracoccus onchidii TaxID=3017813 RepID=A0ABT4ZI29_9RHOB|nr:DeoR/GlpR family DNA-binding transcription regulator [Paracoccus onchidii]MDB6178894.1 DeoR/GlpR family DNA-binding transcription regulator [Paracoccus onchidii]